MKKFALYLFIATTTFLVSCSDDEDAPTVDTSLLAGEWNLTEIRTENGKATATIPASPIPISVGFSLTGKDYNATLTFTESDTQGAPNTFTGAGGFTVIGTLKLPIGDPITEEEIIPDFFGSGEWSISENNLSTTVQGQTITYDIIELTAQKLVLKVSLVGEERTVQDITGTIDSGDQFATFTK